MEAQNNLSPQEEGIIHILQSSLEQEQMLRDQISNPPVGSSEPVLKPEGWVIQSTPLLDEADRVKGIETELADMKANALTNIELLSRSLPAEKQQQIRQDSVVVLYADPNNENSFYGQRDLDKSQEIAMAARANEKQAKTLSAEEASIRMIFPQFFPKQETEIERLLTDPTLNLGSEGFTLSSQQKTIDQNIDISDVEPIATIDQVTAPEISGPADQFLLPEAASDFSLNVYDITEPELD